MTIKSNETNNWKVYIHTNLITGWKYVGITYHDDPNIRWKNGKGYPHNPHFTNAINKYGWDEFSHVIIAENLSKEQANQIEEEYISKYKAQGICYNLTNGGEGLNGYHIPEEQKKRISATLKSKKLQPWNKGKTGVYTDETRERISKTQKGRVSPLKGKKREWQMSDEQRARLSASLKGKNTWSKGSKRGPYSEEHRANISAGLIGKRKGIPLGPRPDDVKAKISAGHKGRRLMSKKWVAPKHVFPDQVEQHLADGWEFGKIIIDGDIAYRWDKPTESWVIYPEARIEQIKKSRR